MKMIFFWIELTAIEKLIKNEASNKDKDRILVIIFCESKHNRIRTDLNNH